MHGGGHVMTIFHVDDGMVAARTAAEADALVDLVASMFSIHELGEPQDMLGIEISRDRDAGTITIRQASKARSLATASSVEGERCATPMTPVVYGELQVAREGDDMADKEAYQSGMGSLLHMTQCMRPDIAALSVALCRGNASLCLSGAYVATRATGRAPMRGLARPSAEVVEAFLSPCVWVWGFWFGFALRCVALLCGVLVRLHLASFSAGGPFLPSLYVNDIAAPVGASASFCSAPTAAHYVAMLNVICYIGCTSYRGITYGHTGLPVEMRSDANFAACLDTRRSVSGWVVVCFEGAVSWESYK
jgi:hypothetical protein